MGPISFAIGLRGPISCDVTAIPLRFIILLFALLEVAVLVLVGSSIGVGWTLLLVLAAVAAGVAILRGQGTAMLTRLRGEVAAGRSPAPTLLDGAAKAVAAVFLIIPGFVGDIIALLLLTPPLRKALFRVARVMLHGRQRAPFGAPQRPKVIELNPDEFEAPARRRGVAPPHRKG